MVLPWEPATATPVLQAHQLSQHLTAGNQRDLQLSRFQDFRVVGRHGRAGDHQVGAAHLLGPVPFEHPSAQLVQAGGDRRAPQVGAADAIRPQRQQDFGDAAHADAADTDEVNALRLKEH